MRSRTKRSTNDQLSSSSLNRVRRRRGGLLLAGLIAVALLLTACGHSGSGGTGVASVGSPSAGSGTATDSSGSSAKASALSYAQCMRTHGVKDFPDPDSDGNFHLDISPGSDLAPDNPTYKAADGACKSLLPPRPAVPANMKAANLKYAKCMRAHGISDFPDPQADGTLQINATPGSDLDPANPLNKNANDACKQYLPNGGGDAGLNTNGGGS
ncbi:MAG: hypothetical protein ACRDRL_02040 [Sciscionella sp.]